MQRRVEQHGAPKNPSRELQHLRNRERVYIELVDNSQAIYKVLEKIAFIKEYDDNALTLGKSGTGKELVARLAHHWSCCAKKVGWKLKWNTAY